MKKDRFYSYQARWSGKPVLHLMPHWNWKKGMQAPVHCYTSFNRVELFVNGVSQGIREKRQGEDVYARYRLIWEDVPYEPGVLEAVAYDENGREAARTQVRTAGEPARLALYPERAEIAADGETYNWVEVRVEDAEGNLCPLAEPMIVFQAGGVGEIVACDNGDPTDILPFYLPRRRAMNGRCMVIMRAKEKGAAMLFAQARYLSPAEEAVFTAK